MKAIVHIGAPKTGTSTLQSFMKANAAELSARGFRYAPLYPHRKSEFELPMAALARLDKPLPSRDEQLRYGAPDLETQKQQAEADIARLAAEVKGRSEHTALFSSEHIFPWMRSAASIASFDGLFREIFSEVHYILYIRNPEDLVLSLYSQNVKNGGSMRLDAYFRKLLPGLDIEPRVRAWVKTVGRERFDLRLFDRDALLEGDLVRDFCAACGIELEGLVPPERVNESLTATAAELLRTMNSRIPRLLPEGGFNPLAAGLVDWAMSAAADGPRMALSEKQRAVLAKHVDDGNERLRKAFFPERKTLFSAPRKEKEEVPLRKDVLEQSLDLAARLIIQLRMGELRTLTADERKTAIRRKPAVSHFAVASDTATRKSS